MKKNIKIIMLIAVITIISGVVAFFYFNQKNNNKSNGKETVEKKKEKEEKKELIVSETDIYRCYRHNNEDYNNDGLSYKYTKYYEFSVLENKVNKITDKIVYIYKFSDKEIYQKFDISKITSDEYNQTTTKDDKKLTYEIVTNISISSKDTVDKEYTLEEYLELLKTRGYDNCEKQQ